MAYSEEIQKDLASCAPFEKKLGRPLYWTEERITELSEDLEKWSKKESSIVIGEFATDMNCNPAIYRKLCAIHPTFRTMYKSALRRLGDRREKGAINKKFEPKTVSKYARFYDEEYNEFIFSMVEHEELLKAKAKIKALTQELDQKGEIIEYLEMQKKVDDVTAQIC